jgi:hypothetical protein
MAIPFTNYVDITSGVIGSDEVPERDLITRIFSTNPLIPANSYAEFEGSEAVGAYFGTTSTEYLMAEAYFSFISKTLSSPDKISFASWVQTNRAPYVYGDPTQTDTLAELQAITMGALTMTLGATTATVSAISFAGDTSLTAVAATLQAAIRAAETIDPVWAEATVTYLPTNPAGACFELSGAFNTLAPGTISFTAQTSGEDVALALGWESANAILSQGSLATSLTNTMIASTNASNNFGSFDFIPTLTEAEALELATWLNTTNVTYMFLLPVTSANADAMSEALIALPGVAMTLNPQPGVYFPELLPGMILAATDYSKANASQNYMFQQLPGLPASVADSADSATYDGLRINYYGQTQQAGQQISFYQRGAVTGAATSPTDMTTYANEMWFKSYVGSQFMTALLTLNEIPTSPTGRGIINNILQSSVQQALLNGTISVPYEPLTNAQISAINQATGTTTAWQQVQTIGYWYTVTFSSYVTSDGRTEYQGNYVLVYTKNNAVRKIVGSHNLV